MEAERAQPVLSGLRSDFLSCLMTGMMELDLLGFNENTQFFVCKHRDYGENGAAGSVLDWGSRGRRFKSCHSDQIKPFFREKGRLFCNF